MNGLYDRIAKEARKIGAEKVVLYGSRARGDFRERSDIDLAVYGLPEALRPRFLEMVDGLPTLLDFDVVFITGQTDPALLANIEKDGVLIMDQFAEKFEKLEHAVCRLAEALEEHDASGNGVVRDGVIQRFEFCTELAWKALREYLLDQGYTEVNSPKAVMKQAYADGILQNEDAWLALLNDRNATSHLYDDATAGQIYARIRDSYMGLFRDLIAKLKRA